MRELAFIIILSTFLTGLWAQEKKKVYYQQKEQPQRYEEDLEKAKTISENKPIRATNVVEKVLAECLATDDKSCIAESYYTLGVINHNSGQHTLAIDYFERSLLIIEKNQLRIEGNDIKEYLSKSYMEEKLYKKAVTLYSELLASTQYNFKKAEYHTGIANAYFELQNYTQAEKHYLEALQHQEKLDNTEGIITACDNLGKLYLELDKNDQALEYYDRSLKLANKINEPQKVLKSTENISKVYRKEKQYDKELNLRQLINKNLKSEDLSTLNSNNLEIAKIYIEQNQQYRAIPYLERTVKISENIGALEEKEEAHKFLSEAYSKQNSYSKALKNYKEYVALHDSSLKLKEAKIEASIQEFKGLSEKQNKISNLEKDMEINRHLILNQSKDLELKSQTLFNQKILIYSLLTGFLGLVAITYFINKSSKQKRIANQLLALKSLRSQMNPHFIFNSLNSVNNYIMKHDERAANKYLADFSKLMRAVMENSQEDFVSLASEIKILDLYLKLEHQRFAEKFEYTFEVDPELDTDNLQVPPMIVQPYIENSVWHGLRYKETKGHLNVKISDANTHIFIAVTDDGIGREKSKALKTINQKEASSTGMKNIRERLKIMNQMHHTDIKIDIIDLVNEGGTKVEILIPKKQLETS